MSPAVQRLLWAVLAAVLYVVAVFVPEASSAHLNEFAALIVGWVVFPRPGDGKAVSGSAAALLFVLASSLFGGATACTPAQRAGLPVLSQLDAVGMGLSQVLGYCEDHKADAAQIAAAYDALERKKHQEAVSIAAVLLRTIGEREQVDREVVALLKLAEGALAAQAIQDGMRALSGPPGGS